MVGKQITPVSFRNIGAVNLVKISISVVAFSVNIVSGPVFSGPFFSGNQNGSRHMTVFFNQIPGAG